MKAIDIVKPEPKTELEAWLRWRNRITSELRSMPGYGKKIVVMEESDWLFQLGDFRTADGKYMDYDGEYITKEEALDAVEWLNRKAAK